MRRQYLDDEREMSTERDLYGQWDEAKNVMDVLKRKIFCRNWDYASIL
jgi:hypothetical protein